MPRQDTRRWGVETAAVREALAVLRGAGRRYVKSRDVVSELGLPDEPSACTVVGRCLAGCDDAIVDRWNDPVSGPTTWRIVPDTPAEVRES